VAGTVYIAPYIITTPELLRRDRRRAERRIGWAPTDVAEGFIAAVDAGEWCYDPADDPSFYSARHSQGGSLSWGICRRNLRNPLSKGDVVAFIGFEERDGLVTYRFCAYATVLDKVTPCAIWNDDDLAVYRRYLNLLARPVDGRFQHYEPHPSGTHKRWLWEMTGGHGLKRKDFKRYKDPDGGMTVRLGIDRAGGKPVRLAKNYVIFERDYPKTFVVDDPLPVANRKKGDRYESWRTDGFATAIKEMTLSRSKYDRKTLYDRGEEGHFRANPNTHVPLRADVDAKSWCDDAAALLKRFGRQSLT
jgi:hypothetical protein